MNLPRNREICTNLRGQWRQAHVIEKVLSLADLLPSGLPAKVKKIYGTPHFSTASPRAALHHFFHAREKIKP
jgi:hypothetical protein